MCEGEQAGNACVCVCVRPSTTPLAFKSIGLIIQCVGEILPSLLSVPHWLPDWTWSLLLPCFGTLAVNIHIATASLNE